MAHTGMALARGIASAYRLMGKNRPGAVIGFGGYPSFPPVLAARMRGIPTALHELDMRIVTDARGFPSGPMTLPRRRICWPVPTRWAGCVSIRRESLSFCDR